MEDILKNQQIPLTRVVDPKTGQVYYSPQTSVYNDRTQFGPTVLKNVIVDNAISASYFSGSIPSATSASYATTASYASNGGVTQIIAGTNILISPTNGLGAITINSTGGGSGTGANTTGSFTNQSTWTFIHGLNSQFPIIQILNSSFEQIIPKSVTLTDVNTVTITFPTSESGYAVASLGGMGTYAATASYALTSTSASYAATASYWSGSISNATSASYALTASYVTLSQTASYVVTAQTASYVQNAQTASYVLQAVSSSFASTASYVTTSQTASYVLNAVTASYIRTPTGRTIADDGSGNVYYTANRHFITASNSITIAALNFIYFDQGTAQFTNAPILPNTLYTLTSSNATQALSSSYALSASYALNTTSASRSVSSSFASTASYVNNLNQAVTIGNITSTPSTENTLNIYPSPAGGTGEGGQILLAASGGLYTSASMLDTYQNQFRLLKGTNTGGSTVAYIITDLQSGNTQFAGAVTASSYSGLPNDYLYATRNGSSQTVGSAWANTDIIFNNVVVSKGISFNTSTGIASLTGGKVYRITARLAWGAAAAYNLQFSCFTSANVQIGPTTEIIQSTNGTSNISDGTLEFIYAPGSNTDIKIRCTNSNSALSGETIRADLNTQFIIQQIA